MLRLSSTETSFAFAVPLHEQSVSIRSYLFKPMARSDLLISLVKAGINGDRNLFNKTVDAIIAEERVKQHHVLADQLEKTIRTNGKDTTSQPLSSNSSFRSLLNEIQPQRNLNEVVLSDQVRKAIDELIEEQFRSDVLRSHNIEPRHRVLLVGPPGNGKTSLAESIATALALPMFTVRYEGVVGSFLGETAGRLLRLFEHVTTRACVLFFDEFDTLGKERGDVHDTGEIKRVVSSLLLQIDQLPSYVIIVAATNHEELLDRAVWRRFQLRLKLPPPTASQVTEWLRIATDRWHLETFVSPRKLAEQLKFESFSELEEFILDFVRRLILSQNERDEHEILSDRVKQWKLRARIKSK